MATRRQELAIQGEILVVEACRCLRCRGSFRPLRKSAPCVDVRCIECGAAAQVRTRRWSARDGLPRKVMGGAWTPQASLLLGQALHDLFIVLVGDRADDRAVYALPGSAQDARLFRPRNALAPEFRGRQAFSYELEPFWPLFRKIEPSRSIARRDQVVHAFPSRPQRERRPPVFTAPVGPGRTVAFLGQRQAVDAEAYVSDVVPIARWTT